ncbi:hypothetical protein [Natronogracilivirga saccharolytica]|uniref:Uncharacterized protein n=1 Tax=Natronogracilivirga saccharolytica TaxID=2812953 RepID=A0A8J7RKN0_9BACT|nr:hypothetical protein [Natronogracilivirga saccharolytica]MBP3191898.1 hypothetical protein [Natronogracilivirga saccharolytica]
MGQQQLLLVILVTILVGIATVVALNVFGTAAEDANRDAVRQDILQGASQAQAIHARPTALDGAGRDFTRIQDDGAGEGDDLITRLGMPVVFEHENCTDATGNYGNENGCYVVDVIDANSLRITGDPSSDPDNQIFAIVSRDVDTGSWEIGWDGSDPFASS